MNRQRIVTAVFAGFLAISSFLHAQISPGPLAKAHQSLTGDTNCTKCHAVSTRAPLFRCLECHQEIAAEQKQNRGLHASYPHSGPEGTACVKCHSDHNGVNFQMIHWDPTPTGFDHSKTGYALDGKHFGVSCRSCHMAQHVSVQARSLLGSKDLNHTWMGLSPSCGTCHEDKHQGRFGADCARCHSTTDWKTANVSKEGFDHSKTRFPLTGEHRYVLCKSCHTQGEDGQPRYSGLAFTNCSDCHRVDPHKGAFKQGCDSCHTTFTWKKSTFSTTFDHSKTHFALEGKHAAVGCVECHTGGDFKTPIAHDACVDCHKPDPHGGQFAKRSDGGKCESCHTVQGWSPSTFSAAEHAKTGFPLVFPHAQAKCASCHVPAGKETRFKIKYALCIDCHKDEHDGQFAAAPWNDRCEKCHDGATFKTTSYSLALHQKSNFPLTGGHIAIACISCHKAPSGTKVIPYHFSQLACTTCHEDVHHGQFAERMAAHNAAGRPPGCEACHSTKGWNGLTKFNHDATRFPLVGSHRAVACAECHKPRNLELTMRHVDFTKTPDKCGECHENPHADQFGSRAQQCESCHNSNKWRPSLFDHERTGFPLKGGHENVACSACHTLKRRINEAEVLFYKPTPKNCEACHGGNIPKARVTSAWHQDEEKFILRAHDYGLL
ncbi:hypothetical protein P8935_02385 [Telmatobacter sp. DSM 110680]|uniref:Cytochrome c7-like domain-containing protein n=1 Tax=Telmatobacter sp. DSM 110680 TaxID=3036704 RepID=A0AAU7DKD6_9BACT